MADYKLQLNNGLVSLVDRDVFEKFNQYSWHLNSSGYAARSQLAKEVGYWRNRKTLILHRVIMNPSKEQEVDHINGDKLDNRRSNLRCCTRAENTYNRPARADNSSGFKGVYYRANRKSPKKWSAQIRVAGKLITLPYAETAEEAALSYNAAAREHFGVFAKLNKIGGV